jgi:hypothetical protein
MLALLGQPGPLVIILAATLLWVTAHAISLRARSNQLDFSHYYVSALALRKGLDPYTTRLETLARPLGLDLKAVTVGNYPPTFLLCFEPLTLLPPRAAYWTWIGFSTLCFALAIYLMLAGEVRLERRLGWLIVALAVLYHPVWYHYKYAQTQLLILLLVVVMMRALARGRDSLAGFSVAAAVALRIFPVMLAGYMMCRQRWRALGWTAGWGAAIGVVTVAAVGTTSFDFLKAIPFLTSREFLARPADISLGAFVSRLFWYAMGDRLTPIEDLARRIAATAAEVAVLVIVVRATLARRNDAPDFDPDRNDQERRALGLWIAAMVLVSPTAWEHYMVLMLIPFLLIADDAARRKASIRTVWAAIASWIVWPVQLLFLATLVPLTPMRFRVGSVFAVAELGMAAQALGFLATYWFVTDRVCEAAPAPGAEPWSPCAEPE